MPDDKGRGVATPLPCVHHSANGGHGNGRPTLCIILPCPRVPSFEVWAFIAPKLQTHTPAHPGFPT